MNLSAENWFADDMCSKIQVTNLRQGSDAAVHCSVLGILEVNFIMDTEHQTQVLTRSFWYTPAVISMNLDELKCLVGPPGRKES